LIVLKFSISNFEYALKKGGDMVDSTGPDYAKNVVHKADGVVIKGISYNF